MSIKKNLEKAAAAVAVDTFKGGDLGERIGGMAVKAITRGIGSDEWRAYMSLFADNEEQLQRLTVEAEGEDSYLKKARAYIVSNAVCDAATGTKTGNNVNTLVVDAGLSEAPDGNVQKPFPIEF